MSILFPLLLSIRQAIQMLYQPVQGSAVAGMRIIIQHEYVVSPGPFETRRATNDAAIVVQNDRRQKIRLCIQIGSGAVRGTIVDCNDFGIGPLHYQFPEAFHAVACFRNTVVIEDYNADSDL